jgi:hypothetical protein
MDQEDANTSGVHFLNVESTSYEAQAGKEGDRNMAHDSDFQVGDGSNSSQPTGESAAGNLVGQSSEVLFLDEDATASGRGRDKQQQNSTTPVASSGYTGNSTPTPMFARRDIVETNNNKTGYTTVPSTGFAIPELPSGQHLTINILSTWGDVFYVGLMGIELFDSSGHRIQVHSKHVTADPSDINILDEYTNDPRTADKLFDGCNHTCDDLHAWLAPFKSGDNHFIFVDLNGSGSGSVCISMMRIWNYNKSRIHSYRGARYVEIKLDKQFIFKGEIQRAPGAMLGSSACSECILFTNNLSILKIIERYDKEPEGRDKYQHRVVGWGDQTDVDNVARIGTGISAKLLTKRDADWRQGWGGGGGASGHESSSSTGGGGRGESPPKFFNPSSMFDRPNTAGSRRSRGFDDGMKGMGSVEPSKEKNVDDEEDIAPLPRRPCGDGSDLTIVSQTKQLNVRGSSLAERKVIQPPRRRKRRPVRPKTAPLNRDGSTSSPHVGRVLEMELLSNWGDPYAIGLTGFQAMDAAFTAIPIRPDMLQLRTTNGDIIEDSESVHQLYHLIDEETTTTDVHHMWCVKPLPDQHRYRLVIDFQKNVSILGLVVWNYNGNADVEETYRGVKRLKIVLDGLEKSPEMLGTLIRKAPGSSSFNFGQFVNLNHAMVPEPTPKQHHHTTTHSTQHSQHRQDGRASDEHVISVPMSSPCLISENVGNSSEKQGGTEDWGWSSSTTGGGSFQRGRGQLNQGGTGDTTSVTTTISTNLQHQTSSDGLTLTEERDGDFDGGDVRQQYETPTLPTGCIFKFILLSTHGDPHYVGLNGLELYDKNNVRIELDETNVEVSFLDSFFFFFSCICFSHPLPTHPTLSPLSHLVHRLFLVTLMSCLLSFNQNRQIYGH